MSTQPRPLSVGQPGPGPAASAPPGERPERARAVELRAVTRRFGELTAVDGADFSVRPGRIHALLGENGAGKTTLLRMLCGYLTPSAGAITLDGTPTAIDSPATALRHGIGMVHQHSVLVPELSVAENVVLGQQHGWLSRFNRRAHTAAVRAACAELSVDVDPHTLIQDLPVDRVQQAEIVRLLHRRVRTLVLDEPTAVLGRVYVDRLFEILSGLRQNGYSIVIITHKLREALALADDITVMRAGRVTARMERAEFDEDRLAQALIGEPAAANGSARTATAPVRADTPAAGPPVLRVSDLTVAGDLHELAVDGLSLDARRGEVLGIAGVEGNGQRELVEALSGLRAVRAGTIELNGTRFSRLTPARLDREDVAVISENRLRWDLVGDLTLAENLMLSRIAGKDPALVRFGFVRREQVHRQAQALLDSFDVRPPEPRRAAATLSGGNQQKAVLAREIDGSPSLVLAAHPTRGLDIKAARFVHDRIERLRGAGSAVLLVSADLDELLALADRILVMYRGQGVLLTETRAADTAAIGRAMAGIH